ncbi:hypothetical protein J2128_000897 [Methanomicrobium sp. W14]|uniref:hypothetical protein n=1 Tax=Methanomicrobium sp. W14 TaxID=2817839 RepID=UPI001AEB7A38|nr:hypothetical protein [Methanomicrobium sp. W14]MBP2132976.1 hypothetical protein [Methanomicrobium sp. W14]
MAINQSQVDHIISAASADDPEVKLQNLQDEVDLLKKSVKKLLIDLRERLNETENPFIVSNSLPQAGLPPVLSEEHEPDENETQGKNETVPEVTPAPDDTLSDIEVFPENNPDDSINQNYPVPADKNSMMLLKKQIEDIEKNAKEIPVDTKQKDRPRLQKLHRLFEWVSRMVKKYGQDRLLIMTESYKAMGYINETACDQVKEISKLMPETIGDFHEISSEEFVAELYVLNRILFPEDSSLDREMIEVMMDKREISEKETSDKKTGENTSEDDWIDLLEKV